jgi:hypothetical protein
MTKKRSPVNLTSSNIVLYHQAIAALRVLQVLYNPHSRNGTAAPRFSPTSFYPPVAPASIFQNLRAPSLWG